MKRRLLNPLTILSPLLGVSVVILCLHPFSYSRSIESGTASIRYVQEFQRTFPNSSHSISYFTGTHGSPTWQSEALVHERYTVTMVMPIRLNSVRNRISSFDQPQFHLVEVDHLSETPDGRTEIHYGPTQVMFGPTEWQRVVDSSDLTSLGVSIHKDRPVAGLVSEWRKANP